MQCEIALQELHPVREVKPFYFYIEAQQLFNASLFLK